MDIHPIKTRSPELSLGVAFLGYIIVTHIVGAYYLTGIQAWPCTISLFIAYIVNPAYFLSFIRRGLELWAINKHHKKMLKRMKQEEIKTLLANHGNDDDDAEDGLDGTYDPDAVAALTQVRMKMEKERKKKLKKKLKEQQKQEKKKKQMEKQNLNQLPKDNTKLSDRNPTTNNSVVLEMTMTTTVSSSSLSRERTETTTVKRKHRARMCSTELLKSEMNAGVYNIKMNDQEKDSYGSSGHHHRLHQRTTLDDGDGPQKGAGNDSLISTKKKNKKNKNGCCQFTATMSTYVRRLYWFAILVGAAIAITQSELQREVGEVGCIAREGTIAYLFAAGVATLSMFITLLLLRKINDEHSIRSELTYVAFIAIAFMGPHVFMLYYAKENMTPDGQGCLLEFYQNRIGSQAFLGSLHGQGCLVQLYANWLVLIMVLLIHTTSISYPVILTLQMGADKLREHSIISKYSYEGPQLLTSFDKCVGDQLCSKYFRRFLANEFTLDNMRFLVDIEDFKITLIPTQASSLSSMGIFGNAPTSRKQSVHNTTNNNNNNNKSSVSSMIDLVQNSTTSANSLNSNSSEENDSSMPTFARACHTINAWQTFSGNMPISLISPGGRQRMIGNQLPSNHWFINDDDGGVPTMMNRHNEHFIDIGDMINRARITVRKYYSNPFWCKLYTKTKINVTFKNMYQTLLDIQSKAMKQRKVIDADNKIIAKLLKTKGQEEAMIKAKEQYDMQFSVQRKLLKTLYVVFDEVEAMLKQSLICESYPKFVSAEIGQDLRKVLELSAKSRIEYEG